MQDEDKHGKLYILERNSGGLDGKVSSNTPQCYEDFKAKCATYSISDNKNYLPSIQLKIKFPTYCANWFLAELMFYISVPIQMHPGQINVSSV